MVGAYRQTPVFLEVPPAGYAGGPWTTPEGAHCYASLRERERGGEVTGVRYAVLVLHTRSRGGRGRGDSDVLAGDLPSTG